jgi:ornithine cyclodeaminase/alanine dehydrogenase
MKKVELIFLSQEEIMSVNLSLNNILEIVENAFKEHSEKTIEVPPKPGIHPAEASFIHAMPAYLKKINSCGIKWVSGYPKNRDIGLPMTMGVLVLNDVKTGAPLAIMDCRWITAVRTAAVTAITAKYCARYNSEVIGIIGAGIQSRYQARMIELVVPSAKYIKVFDINETSVKKYISDLSNTIKLKIIKANSIQETVESSDIVVSATQRMNNPIIKDEWLKVGSLACPLESGWLWEKETVEGVDKFITDDYKQMKSFAGQGAIRGDVDLKFYAELGEIVSGNKQGRENDDERILAINEGLAISDVAVADKIYKIASNNNIGTKLTLMESEI